MTFENTKNVFVEFDVQALNMNIGEVLNESNLQEMKMSS